MDKEEFETLQVIMDTLNKQQVEFYNPVADFIGEILLCCLYGVGAVVAVIVGLILFN